MAKYGNGGAFCGKCNMPAQVSIQNVERDVSYSDRGTTYGTAKQIITVKCGCSPDHFDGNNSWLNYSAKETTVTQQYDTTTEKSVALSNVMNRVRKLEVALFTRAQELGIVEAEHAKNITDASIALDRVLIEAWQVGVNMEEYDKFLPDYADKLQGRLEEVVEIISLANAELTV